MGDFIQAQAQYAKDYQDWRINELARQEVLDEFERSCLARGPAGLVNFAQVAGSLETAEKCQWFKNGLQYLKDLQAYDFGTPAERKEAREVLKALREMFPQFIPLKRGPDNKLTTEEAEANRKTSNYKAGTKRNHRQAARRLIEEVQRQEQWYLTHGRTAPHARREAVRYVLNEFKQTSLANDKDVILAIFKDFLKNNYQH